MSRLVRLALWFGALGGALAAAWVFLVPRTDCYLTTDFVCGYYVDATSSVFFFQDALFAGLALACGVVTTLTWRSYFSTAFRVQFISAISAVAVSYLAFRYAGRFTEGSFNLATGIASDRAELRSWTLIAMWPAAQQMLLILIAKDSSK